MKTYSDFTKDKIFEVHSAIMNYLRKEENEKKYWKLYDLLKKNKTAIPTDVADVLEAYLNQYLEKSLFGKAFSIDKEVEIECLKDFKEKDRPNLAANDYIRHWFNLADMYDVIAEEVVKPALLG